MGRWAQRQRTGGGFSLNFITAVFGDGPNSLFVQYLTTVDATQFAGTDFINDFAEVPTAVVQHNSTRLRLDFATLDIGSQLLSYSGQVPSVLTPQSVPYQL
jgi:hypothetical protein